MNGEQWRAEVRKALAASHKAARNRRGKRPDAGQMATKNVHIIIRPFTEDTEEPPDKEANSGN